MTSIDESFAALEKRIAALETVHTTPVETPCKVCTFQQPKCERGISKYSSIVNYTHYMQSEKFTSRPEKGKQHDRAQYNELVKGYLDHIGYPLANAVAWKNGSR